MEIVERLKELRVNMNKVDEDVLSMIQRGQTVVAGLEKLSPNQVFDYCSKMLRAMSISCQGQLAYSQIETQAKSTLDMAKSVSFLEGKEELGKFDLKDTISGRERIISNNPLVIEANNLHGEAEAKAIFCRDNFQIYKSALETAKKIIDLEKGFVQNKE